MSMLLQVNQTYNHVSMNYKTLFNGEALLTQLLALTLSQLLLQVQSLHAELFIIRQWLFMHIITYQPIMFL